MLLRGESVAVAGVRRFQVVLANVYIPADDPLVNTGVWLEPSPPSVAPTDEGARPGALARLDRRGAANV